MALTTGARSAQWPLLAEFVINFNDTMKDTTGAVKSLGATAGTAGTAGGTFMVIPLPPGSVLISGELIPEAAGAGPTVYTAAFGYDGAPGGLLGATDLIASPLGTKVPFVIATGSLNPTGKNIIMTLVATVANATAGKARVRVMYSIDGKSDVVQIN